MSAPRALFVGLGQTGVCWYRCALPAYGLGADWCGVAKNDPPGLAFLTGDMPVASADAFFDYDVVVLQQPRGLAWVRFIGELRAAGVKVLFEVDDYLHAVRKQEDNSLRGAFSKQDLADLEMTMRASDGIICSTEFIARRYRAFNPNTYVCENGLDVGRYRMTLPERDHVAIGWSGGTGHAKAMKPWIPAVVSVLEQRAHTRWVTVGQDFTGPIVRTVGADRALAVPFSKLDVYPASMTNFDIALAPAGRTNFYRGKSDLRFLEAGALGLPLVADPVVYPRIEHGVTGFHAETPEQARDILLELVDDPGLRRRVGAAAKEYVHTQRTHAVVAQQWARAFEHVLSSSAAPVPAL